MYANYEVKTSKAAEAFREAKEDYERLLNSGAKKTELELADRRKQEYSAAHAAAKLQQDRFFATFQQIKHQYETAMSAAENEDLALGEVDEQTAALQQQLQQQAERDGHYAQSIGVIGHLEDHTAVAATVFQKQQRAKIDEDI